MKLMIPVVTWSEIRQAIQQGRKGLYVDNGVSYQILVDGPPTECEIMRSDFLKTCDSPDILKVYNLEESLDFEQNFKSQLVRSRRSIPEGDSPAPDENSSS